MKINKELKKYIENEIFPIYKKNDLGHNLDHIKYVIDRSIIFASKQSNINLNMVYVIAAYHDIGHHIDAKNHEKVSAEILLKDSKLREFFTEEEMITMSEAIYDHRASLETEPRSIYGKIVSSADRNTLIEVPLMRTYAYRVEHNPNDTLDEIIEQSRQHLLKKFGKKGYASEKMYFEDSDYKKFLDEIEILLENPDEFKRKFIEVNRLNNKMKLTFDEIKRHNPTMSLDEVLYAVYETLKDEYNKPFDTFRNIILEENGIDELEFYTKNVKQDLKDYITECIFPEYAKNDGGHNIAHILEVIRRSFALNDTFKLDLDENMIYTIAACHDWGKYEDHSIHHLIAARNFMNDEGVNRFFTPEQKQIIKEAIEDHRSSKEDEPRSIYGKLISSADRNTRIEIVFIRSFFVAHERMPETIIEEYLDYTIERLSKKYDEENPENMFFEDETYKVFIQDMRALLKNEQEFKKRYCEVNHITSREHRVKDEQGETSYIKVLNKK